MGNPRPGLIFRPTNASAHGRDSLAKIAALREVYALDLTAADSHLLVEARPRKRTRTGSPGRTEARADRASWLVEIRQHNAATVRGNVPLGER